MVVRAFLFLLLVTTFIGELRADVYALISRDEVQLNESFTLVLIADRNEQGEPDIDGLSDNFDILGRSQSSSMSIVNGQRETSRRWTYSLLPKALGDFEIPSLSVGGVSSQPVRVRVTEPVVAPAGDPDIFLEASIDRNQSWVQAQVIYTLKIYQGVAIRQNQLEPLRVEGGEVIATRLGEDRRYEATIDGRQFDVVERTYALFPQESGEYEIQPAVFRGSLYSRGRISAPQEFRSEALQLSVAPAVPPPAQFADALWLPASELQLSASMEPRDGILDEGVPANIVVDTVVRGLQANQLPELELDVDPALRVYPDQPDFASRELPDGVIARRQQSFAVIAGRGGVYDLPTITLPWFDVDTGEWRVASAELGSLRAAGQVDSQPAPVVVEPEPEAALDPEPTAPPVIAEDRALRAALLRARLINYGLLALWLLTMFIMWRAPMKQRRKRKRARVEADQNATYRTARKARKVAMQAAQRGDASAARDALLDWAREALGPHAASGLVALAALLPAQEATAVLELDRALYGASEDGWDGARLAKVINSLDRPGAHNSGQQRNDLPALFPSS
ncbi:MAG: BatD family protein [Pseudomonadota bacterium]